MTAASSARSCCDSDSEPTASPAAEIAVSGERRSWETARKRAVLTASARRSAAVSTTPPSSPSRSSAALNSASSAGTTRSCSRRRLSSEVSAPTSSVPRRLVPSRSGNAMLRSSPSTASISIAAELSSSVCASRAAAVGSASARLFPRSRSRAISAARSASRRRASASRVRARVTSATELARTGDHQEGDQRHPVARVPDRELAHRGQVKEVEGPGADDGRGHTQPRPPGHRDHEHRRQVDDAQRDHRGHVLQRVDDQRAQRHRPGGDDHAHPPWRRIRREQEAERE